MSNYYDLVVIGAGPAGMSAAVTASQSGMTVAVFDEQQLAGGQIYRSLEATPLQDRTILGVDYWEGETLIHRFHQSNVDFFGGCSVWDINEENEISFTSQGNSSVVKCQYLILATGALERNVPFDGWDLNGVMTAGAGQILLKDAGLVADSAVLVGSGPLLDVLAYQYVKAGVVPKAIVDTTPTKII